MPKQNIVKETCKELGITQGELGKLIGVKEVTINKWSSSKEIPEQGLKSLEILTENYKMKKDLHIVEMFKNYIKNS